jgi:methylase of polypeptide subunit release factors
LRSRAHARTPKSAAQHPDLLAEPAAAVFAAGDGLETYRRLVDAAATQLANGGALLLQLNRRVVEASRSKLPALRAALGNTFAAAAA